ncbi:response regulator transcription factor [Dactylosporangium vinaceum]|uniref:Response regulator n=1 Tax=Dactylosporangium vinaceum TaxID=53362 RepID=A0ABV5M4U7_9ACTN|nr:response regulator transcription factor [Dactylosporangium vinaceum]UAB96073.1 response regulator transcription factor [Dactylosporangium vinaceum]
MTARIRVLIADDEPLMLAGIRTVLESAPDLEVVAAVTDGAAAVAAAGRLGVDVALLDVRMPLLSGLDAMAALSPGTAVVILTSFGDEPSVLRALSQGASGYVLKTCTPDELIRAVRSAHNGDAYLSPPVARQVLTLLGPSGAAGAEHRRAAARRLSTLSPREADVLRLVAEGLSNADIGTHLHMTEPSVKTHVSRILTKLDCTNRVQAALLHREATR